MRILTILFLFCCYQVSAQVKPLQFKQSKFKILQFTDLHYKQEAKESEVAILNLNEALDAEKPDLVVFTGDVVTANPVKGSWDKVLEPVIKRGIPWTVSFGNHDDEQDWSRKQIMDYLSTKRHFLGVEGPVYGYGNSYLRILSDNVTKAIIYIMDSNTYSKLSGVGGYAWFQKDQIEWYKNLSSKLTKENGDKPYPALAFFHIPLNEYETMVAKDTIIGTRGERECPGAINSGMFLAMKQAGDVMGVFTGHDHDNDYIGMHHGICLAYGRFSGGNTIYNNLKPNGCRVIILDENSGFDTYVRLRGGEKLHNVNYPQTWNEIKAKKVK